MQLTPSAAPADAIDLVCLGNAITDILAPEPVGHDFGSAQKGGMTLIDAAEASRIEASIRPERIEGGGSAANTAVVARAMGATCAYLGRVADDEAGKLFAQDMVRQGVQFPHRPRGEGGLPTARCIVLVGADGTRTMHTYLGACAAFSEEDLDEAVVRQARVTYLEGYLFDLEPARLALTRAAEIAREAGGRVALSLSDSFCISRHRASFLALLPLVDILFANEAEIMSLYETDEFDAACALVARAVPIAALTRDARGSVVISGDTRIETPALPVTVRDTTGAGDAYAAGFLAGYTAGRTLSDCADLGTRAASAVITRYGARPGPEFDVRRED